MGSQVHNIMQINCHSDDKKWALAILKQLPADKRNRAIAGYNNVMAELTEKHAGEIACENIARREANTRLRGYYEKITGRNTPNMGPPPSNQPIRR